MRCRAWARTVTGFCLLAMTVKHKNPCPAAHITPPMIWYRHSI
ncbi:hypothetical protein AS9A_P10021 (plasmid) [Hoyosella subflava DQS3-9A1]|uniref:Uncharacterized protein n=1 Tax=Hoyosella subflava (strain DSM 45089 / JCM 17490 / NBRC 109087 / DQS3-9A1) TaxID=443218 RepID=F6ESB8_HOYSD|nr:hypothetical protein AS9A_P10021 [Hoyosella subflava DQS3-9A1]